MRGKILPDGMLDSPSGSPALRLLGFLAPFKGWLALAVLLGIATLGSGVGLMASSAYIISRAALHPSISELQLAIVGVRFFGLARGVFRYLERYVSHQITFRLLARLRVWFYRALEPLAPARLLQFRSGDLLNRIIADISSLENLYVRAVAPPLVAVLTALGVGAFLWRFDARLALVLLGIMALAGVVAPVFIRWLGRLPGHRLVTQRAELSACLVDGVQGLADLLVFGQAQVQAGRIGAISQQVASAQMHMAFLSGLQVALESLLANLGMWSVLVVAVGRVAGGYMDGVYLAVLGLTALTSFEAIAPLPQAMRFWEGNLASARRLFDLVDARPAITDPVSPLSLTGDASLVFNRVSFRYPRSSLPGVVDSQPSPGEFSLTDVSLNLPPGGRVAVVGPSGSGKTSLAFLLLRFWEYDGGQILLGGQDICHCRANEVRARISVVTQNTVLFNATVSENLKVARPGASQEEIVQAARLAQAHEFIEALPQGYQTPLGEQGLRLSGGERQRLAIARAWLKEAPVLVLDEPTADLDAITERVVLQSIFDHLDGRSLLLITHRLVGMEKMDEILVLQDGCVVERGCHADLLKRDGLYRRLWDLQNQYLADLDK
jgi:ATP-binding cassette subfamily C protein CydC